MKEQLSLIEAYKAMFLFLEDYYFRFGQNDLSDILSALELQPNGKSADPAAWDDWLAAVKTVLEEKAV